MWLWSCRRVLFDMHTNSKELYGNQEYCVGAREMLSQGLTAQRWMSGWERDPLGFLWVSLLWSAYLVGLDLSRWLLFFKVSCGGGSVGGTMLAVFSWIFRWDQDQPREFIFFPFSNQVKLNWRWDSLFLLPNSLIQKRKQSFCWKLGSAWILFFLSLFSQAKPHTTSI